MTQLERDIERALVGMVKRHGGLCLKWVCPGWSGVPDRIILLPGGRLIFVELKRPKGGRVDPLQGWWRGKLISLGFRHFIIKNKSDIHMLEEVGLDESAPAVDAVPVVRCKDCEYYEAEECVNPYIFMSDGAHLYSDVNDFCSYGERRADA